MTAYQKLKAKVAELESKLMTVCNEPDSEKAFEIKMEYILKNGVARQIWYGSVDKRYSRFTGIMPLISKT